MTARLVVVGDVLLDIDVVGRADRLAPDAPVPVVHETLERARPGGAGLTALLLAFRADRPEVTLICPLADDAAAARVRALLQGAVRVIGIPYSGATPVKTRIVAGDRPLVRVDTGEHAGLLGGLPTSAIDALRAADGVLVSDYGRRCTADERVRSALAAAATQRPLVWDPHPAGAVPVPGTLLVTPNHAELARLVGGGFPAGLAGLDEAAKELLRQWPARAAAVTLGRDGALLSLGAGAPLVVPPPVVHRGDPCGAGDCFAGTVTAALAGDSTLSDAVCAGVHAAASYLEAGGAAAIGAIDSQPVQRVADSPVGDAEFVAAETHRCGGVLVATGGCFDLLHPGHVETLQAARRLGDALIVCINSDESVRRLKGPGRPVQPLADRARMVAALAGVDAVLAFDEDTPLQAIRRLRPDVWVKGGDYSGAELPEADLLARWGGCVATVPFLAGRSTTSLLAATRTRVG